MFTNIINYLSKNLNLLYKKILLFLFKDSEVTDKSNKSNIIKKSPHLHVGLFDNKKIIYQNFNSTSTYLRQCAVSDFDYDFTSPNPFNWDFQDLLLNNNNNNNNNNNVNKVNNTNTSVKSSSNLNPNNQSTSYNQLLENFNNNFQNNLRNNEIIQLNENNHLIYPSLNNNLTKFNNFNDEILSDYEFDDDDYINKLSNNNNTNIHVKHNIDINIDDLDDPLPLDDELMLSYIRLSDNSNYDLNYENENENENENKFNSDYEDYHYDNNHIQSFNNNTINPLKREYIEQSDNNITITKLNENNNNIINNNNKKLKKHSNNSIPSSSSATEFESPSPNSSIISNKNKTKNKDKDKNKDKIYTCSICNTTFKVKGYLTRHLKKHAKSKPFHCPYFDSSIEYIENNNNTEQKIPDDNLKIPRCHPTGGFSRRDTFKTHLKALHFVYPTGTKSNDRIDKHGRCAACFKEFSSNKDWLENHVMTNECEGMITKYK